MIGVSPVAMGVFGFAPTQKALNQCRVAVRARERQRRYAESLAAFTSAPARIRSSAVSRSFQCAAQSSAVAPSEDSALT